MTIAIYSRKSKFTGKGDSIANQIELCKQEALRYLNNKKISEEDAEIHIYEDEGFSGKNTARPEYQRLMSAVRADTINCVISYKLDRISRNVGDFARTYEEFEKHGVDFLCVNEKYDTTSPAGRAMMGMVSVFAQLERETTAERIRDNMHMLARSGRWLGGHTPTGFRSEKEERVDVAGKTRLSYRLVPAENEMALVKFIYEKFMELQSISGTARYLLQSNIRTKNDRDFTYIAVKDILTNPVYCTAQREAADYFEKSGAEICFEEQELDSKHGFMPYNRTSCGKTQQVKNEISDWIIAVGKHIGIVQAEEWVETQRILNAKAEKNKSVVRTPYKSEALLSGLLICDKCQSPMRPHVHSGRRNSDGRAPYYYICELKERSSKKRCDMCNANGILLDKAIIGELSSYVFTDYSMCMSLHKLKGRLIQKKENELKQSGFLETELMEKQKEINNLIEALAAGETQDFFAQQIRTRVNHLAAQCEGLKTEIEKAALNNNIYPGDESLTKAKNDILKVLTDGMQTATAIEKRELLKSIIGRIAWNGECAHIFLSGV